MAIIVNLCYNQSNDFRRNSKPTKVKLDKLPQDKLRVPLPQGISCFMTSENICVHAFDAQIRQGAYVWLVQMNLPDFFNEVQVAGESGIQGLFMVGLRSNLDTPRAHNDKQHGNNGCPTVIYMGDLSRKVPAKLKVNGYTANRFTFNKMSFHPFLMIDMTIGYYVCDQGGPMDWGNNEKWSELAVDQPIVYDATLGLYVTRAAHLVNPNTLKKK